MNLVITPCILMLLFSTISAFEVRRKSPKAPVKVPEGDSITLSAKVDDYYEWCLFKAPDGKICDFQWKKPEWNVTVLNCSDFSGRFRYAGDFNNYVCAVTIDDIRADESGEWTVELENYYNGYTRNYGYKTRAKFVVTVERPITTTSTTSATSKAELPCPGLCPPNDGHECVMTLTDKIVVYGMAGAIVVAVNIILILGIMLRRQKVQLRKRRQKGQQPMEAIRQTNFEELGEQDQNDTMIMYYAAPNTDLDKQNYTYYT